MIVPDFNEYRKKANVSAARITGDNLMGCAFVCSGKCYPDKGLLVVPSLEGAETAHVGDWLMRGIDGEYYVCADGISRRTYELAED